MDLRTVMQLNPNRKCLMVCLSASMLNNCIDKLGVSLTQSEKVEYIKYVLSKVYGYDLGEWDHRCVSHHIIQFHEQCKRDTCFRVKLPTGVSRIEHVTITAYSFRILCEIEKGDHHYA